METQSLLDNVLNEGSIVIVSEELKVKLIEYIDKLYAINMKNMYDHSPDFFSQLKTNDLLNKYYKKFIILCCLIDFPNIDEEHEQQFVTWRQLHNDSNVKVLLQGPKSNSKMKFDFVKYYNNMIKPTIETMDGYRERTLLESNLQALFKLEELTNTIQSTVSRLPHYTNGYQLFIDTAKITRKMIIDGNYMIDCSQMDFGEPNIGTPLARIKKLEYLFNTFSCLRLDMKVWKDLYSTPLDVFKHCFVVFDGISVFERTIYNTDITHFKIGGKFVKNGDWFVFVPDFNKVVYKCTDKNDIRMNDVNRFRIYIVGDDKSIKLKNDIKMIVKDVYNQLIPSDNGYYEIYVNSANTHDIYYFDSFSNTLSGQSLDYDYKFSKQVSPEKINKKFLDEVELRVKLDTGEYDVIRESGNSDHSLFAQLIDKRIDITNSVPTKIMTFGNGRLAVKLDSNYSTFIAKDCLFMRSHVNDIYYVYSRSPPIFKQGDELFRDGKEIEMMMKFD